MTVGKSSIEKPNDPMIGGVSIQRIWGKVSSLVEGKPGGNPSNKMFWEVAALQKNCLEVGSFCVRLGWLCPVLFVS